MSSGCNRRWVVRGRCGYAYLVPILEQVQSDTREAMKAGERDRVGALRMLADALQKDLKEGGEDEIAVLRRERKRRLEAAEAYREGGDDEVAVLRRERKRRLEAAEAYRDGGSGDRADAEEAEAKLIEAYLPEEIPDDELAKLVAEAIAEAGAADPSEMGKVMGAVMPQVGGRADGKRVSAMVREHLAAGN